MQENHQGQISTVLMLPKDEIALTTDAPSEFAEQIVESVADETIDANEIVALEKTIDDLLDALTELEAEDSAIDFDALFPAESVQASLVGDALSLIIRLLNQEDASEVSYHHEDDSSIFDIGEADTINLDDILEDFGFDG